jgi:hypothetical protein
MMNTITNENVNSTGRVGICLSGNLDTPHLSKDCNGINIVIDMEDGALLPSLLSELKFIGRPEIDVVELLPNEELFDIKGFLNTVNKRRSENPAALKPKAANRSIQAQQ